VVAEDGDPVEGVDHRRRIDEQRELVVGEVLTQQVVLVVAEVAVGDEGDGLSDLQRSLLEAREHPGFQPGGQHGDPLGRLTATEGEVGVQVEAEGAAVDLGRP